MVSSNLYALRSQGRKDSSLSDLATDFHFVLEDSFDFDTRTPSPLTLTFDLSKTGISPSPRSPIIWSDLIWSDSDSDPESEDESNAPDDVQYINVTPTSPFYIPHSPSSRRTVFDLPVADGEPIDEDYTSSAAALFHAELSRIESPEIQCSLFLMDGACLEAMDDVLFSAPLQSLMDLCVSRLTPDSPTRYLPDRSTPLTHYHLASFLDLDDQDTAQIPPSLLGLFTRRAVLSDRLLVTRMRRWPTVLGITAIVLVGWAGFLTYVTNETKVTSSVVKQILRTIKAEAPLQEVLGYAIRPQPEWWLNGYPIIHGQACCVVFRFRGLTPFASDQHIAGQHRRSGTVYFTSVRKAKGMPYEILRFRVIADDGQVIEVQTGLEPEEDS
ncbi:unnamed protein product [Mycena citricolor]|uniref:Uncharacterized protein n=1 Tax=Mycena citricolor TaxID=2018698 RepID=A0AAD2Q1Y3_9AGAR|nr:unnamed protein product [Mycena citricolor]